MQNAKKKIALIVGRESDWISCRTIKNNLQKSYGIIGEEFSIFEVGVNTDWENDYCEVYQELKKIDPDMIVVLDHYPVPYKLFLYLSLDESFKSKRYIFHLYGDFMYFLSKWYGTLSLVKNLDVKFICASHAQSSLIKALFNNGQEVETIPFPVDDKIFNFSQDLRKKGREKLGLKDEEVVLLYTGRLSFQKNIVKLCDSVKYLNEKFQLNVKLFIAGSFDDLGVPYLKHQMLKLFHLNQCKERFKDPSIVYLGVKNQAELVEIYNACDIYTSFSVHNDEDFGMSPAEAFMCGMSGCLSHWGGFKSFQGPQIKHVSVNIDEKSIDIDSKSIVKSLFSMINTFKIDDNQRIELADNMSKTYSISNVSIELKKILQSKPSKFLGFREEVANQAEKARNDQLFDSVVKSYSKDYINLYKGIYD